MRIQVSFDCELCNQHSDQCHSLAHINSKVPPGDDGMVVIVIPLGNDQFDLAVDKAIVERVRCCVTDRSNLRLLSSDPLFVVEYGRSYPETAFHALMGIICQYHKAASLVYKSNDQRCIQWIENEIDRLDTLLKHYEKQI